MELGQNSHVDDIGFDVGPRPTTTSTLPMFPTADPRTTALRIVQTAAALRHMKNGVTTAEPGGGASRGSPAVAAVYDEHPWTMVPCAAEDDAFAGQDIRCARLRWLNRRCILPLTRAAYRAACRAAAA